MSVRSSPLTDSFDPSEVQLTEYRGWTVPVEFDSTRFEHDAVRTEAGKFDESNRGVVVVSGSEATDLVQRLTTNDVTALAIGEGQYTAMTRQDGTLLEYTRLYRLPESVEGTYLFQVGPVQTDETIQWWTDQEDEWGFDADIDDQQSATATASLVGPDATAILADITAIDVAEMSELDIEVGDVDGIDVQIAQVGWSEEGYEILCEWTDLESLWEALDCQPCGIGARDILRQEAGIPAAGREFELDEQPRNPFELGLGGVVALDTSFEGRDSLAAIEAEGPTEVLTGVRLRDHGVPRKGDAVRTPDGEVIGEVTSGTMSPTLGTPIALALLPAEIDIPDAAVEVMIRDEPRAARMASLPFVGR